MVKQCEHSETAEILLQSVAALCNEPRWGKFTFVHPLSKQPTDFVDVTEFENRLAQIRARAYDLVYWWENE